MNDVAIVDYGLCNLDSIARAVEQCGGRAKVTANPADLSAVNSIILPGVGTFGDAMHNLRERGLDQALTEQVIDEKIPFLGICLGMHLIAARGTEQGDHGGLGWIDGEVIRLKQLRSVERTLHIGWNEVHFCQSSKLFEGVPEKTDFYFMHSYHFACKDQHIVATTPYCGKFTSAICDGHILGVQFHPEKSQKAGFQVLRNFLAL